MVGNSQLLLPMRGDSEIHISLSNDAEASMLFRASIVYSPRNIVIVNKRYHYDAVCCMADILYSGALLSHAFVIQSNVALELRPQ